MKRFVLTAALSATIFGACDHKLDPSEGSGAPGTSTTRLALTVDIDPGVDAAGIRYGISSVPCAGGEVVDPPVIVSEDVPLLGHSVGDFGAFGGAPLDADADHGFADLYQVLPAGCYDITAQPLDPAGEPSADCAGAGLSGVEVVDGQTTEVMLLLQCDGAETGGLDSMAAFNLPPTIVDLSYSPAKFVSSCGGDVTVCASAIDPDGDPIEMVWTNVGGTAATLTAGEPTVVPTDDGDVVTVCATMPAGAPAAHTFEVTAFDMLHDATGLVRIEDWLAAQGYASASRDSLEMPLYVGECATGGTGTGTGGDLEVFDECHGLVLNDRFTSLGVTFERESGRDVYAVRTGYATAVTIGDGSGGQVVEQGNHFNYSNDIPAGDVPLLGECFFGSFYYHSNFDALVMRFDTAQAVLSGDLIDVDGAQNIRVEALDANGDVLETVFRTGAGGGNGAHNAPWAFNRVEVDIVAVRITDVGVGLNGGFGGWAMDNFAFTAPNGDSVVITLEAPQAITVNP